MDVERQVTEAEARALAELGAAAAAGDDERLRAAFPEAVELAGADAVEELLLQTYLFAGFPRAINAFYAWQGWASRAGIRRGARGLEPEDPDGWRRRGEALCRLVYGQGYEALQGRLARLHPALAEFTLVEGYGKVLSREGADPARRELAAVGALVAVGAERQLRAHLLGAVHAGVPAAIVAGAARVAAGNGGGELLERLLADLGWERT